VAAAAVLTVAGPPAAAAAGNTPPPASTAQWQKAVQQLRTPGKGCFTASYPMLQWHRTRCTTAPHRPYAPAPSHRFLPASGPGPQTAGGAGGDYEAAFPASLAATVTGSFDSITPGATEGQPDGHGQLAANTFSLQLNTEPFTTPICQLSPNPSSCQGWQQFVYSTIQNGIFIQDWLVNYDLFCPPGWTTYVPPSNPAIMDCYMNSTATQWPGPALTVQDLTSVHLTGVADLSFDTVTLTTASGQASASTTGDTLGLWDNWTGAEWGIYGESNGAVAIFSPATTLTARTTVNGTAPPTCVFQQQSFTAETNNLNLVPAPAIGGTPASPTLVTTQTIFPSGLPGCATAAGAGGTHLKTFGNLLYSFEAAGDFELATTGPHFTVEDRQVPDTPAWPNAAITQAAGARVGTTDVAVCTAPTRLMINNQQVPLADGGHLTLPGGSKVSRTGTTYLIQDKGGDSLTAAVNPGTPGWIDTSVGLGRWPETVHGLLANAGTNPHAVQARGGAVLTAPFNFSQFYNTYGNSWRIPATQSLLSACGTKVPTSNPTNVFYAGNLPPKLATTARAACVAAGVTAAPLLDACTVDTAVLGTSAITAYQGLPANVTWGKITPPAASTHTTRN
jgi:hypothetical protein